MATLKLTDGDLVFDSNGRLEIVTGSEEIAQKVRTSLRLFQGEWELAPLEGTPYYPNILGSKPANLGVVESLLRATILRIAGVEEIDRFELDYDAPTRKVSLTFSARIQSGELVEFPPFEVIA